MTAKSKAKSDMPAPPPSKRRKNNNSGSGKDEPGSTSQDGNTPGPSTNATNKNSVIGVTRSISACQRCRSRKTRCDQKFPSCTACLKAGVECVGIDAATGREIPRSYVSHLEDRVAFLEGKLQTNGIEYDEKAQKDSETAASKNPKKREEPSAPGDMTAAPASKLGNLMTAVKMVNDRPPRQKLGTFLGQSSGLSFARILFTAVKQQQRHHSAARPGPTSTQAGGGANSTATAAAAAAASGGSGPTSTASSGSTASNQQPPQSEEEKPRIKPARLPTKEMAESFLSSYFAQANAQLPILHREDFLRNYFEPIYGKLSTKVSLANDYTSIGVDCSDEKDMNCYYFKHCYNVPEPENADESTLGAPNHCLFFLNMVFGIATSIHQQQYPAHISESYRLAAAHHFDAVFASANRLESLQGLLLLALYSIMRPATPGVWYVLGSALRLCIDLGLHYEGGLKSWSNHHNNHGSDQHANGGGVEFDAATLDMRRRLFWCTYTLDRQVCVYLGRPFGIPDESVKVSFPSDLDDTLITRQQNGITDYSKEKSKSPSYKAVALSFCKLRQLQSEIQKIMYDCAELPRRFKSMNEWKHAMARKLEDWHDQCPKSNRKMNCNFNLAFMELNYHQTRLLLYGLSPGNATPNVEGYLIIADAGEKVIKKYHELHRKRNINYTWVAVHNLFMAGTSYLYALYHSPEVRAGTTLEEIDFNTLACIHVLSSMTDRCDAAAGCRDSFELLTAAIMKLCYNEKAGIVMTLNRDDHTPGAQINNNAATSSNAHQTPFDAAVARRQSVKEGLKHQDEAEGIEPPQTNTDVTWPMPDDLEMFFQEAAQLEGISPDSMRANGAGASQSPETASWYSNPGSEHEGGDAMVIEQDRGPRSAHPPHPHQARNDQQRIYDLINEVPLAPIWDQFFATGQHNPNSNQNQAGNGNGNGGTNPGTPMSDMLGSRWPH